MLTSPPEFAYTDLTDAATYIRVLTIQPDDDHATLTCSLVEIILNNSHNCLSYTWGSDTASEAILINGKIFRVRPNLWRFLHTARRYGVTGPLWVDAICINQDDNNEKASQVGMMGDIYYKASSVIVWLDLSDDEAAALSKVEQIILHGPSSVENGGSGHDADLWHDLGMAMDWHSKTEARAAALHFLWVYQRRITSGAHDEYSLPRLPGLEKWFTALDLESHTMSLRSLREEYILAHLCHPVLDKIYLLPYWQRAWVVQEFALADHAVIMRVDGSIDLPCLLPFLRRRIPASVSGRRASWRPFTLHPATFDPRTHKTLHDRQRILNEFRECLSLTVERDCREKRDRIYATLSMLTHGKLFPVNYNTCDLEIFAEMLIFTLKLADMETTLDMTQRYNRTQQIMNAIFHCLQLEPPAYKASLQDLEHLQQNFDSLVSQGYWIECEPALRGLEGTPFEPRADLALVVPITRSRQRLLILWPIPSYRKDEAYGIPRGFDHNNCVIWSSTEGKWSNARADAMIATLMVA